MTIANKIAWAAGFIEGEGHVRYQPSGNGGCLILTASQALLEPLEKLTALFGGRIRRKWHKRKWDLKNGAVVATPKK